MTEGPATELSVTEPAAALRRIVGGENLTAAEVESLFGRLMDGEVSQPLKAALLVGLAMKGEAIEEIAGAAEAMRRRAVPIEHSRRDVVDTCGTGGDSKGTFNISTAAALVAAAAGVPVAKHGNRSVSSRSGSADVLAALGVDVNMSAHRAAAALDVIGIAFLFAPILHPAMREVMPVRRELGIRTLFNVLGPLTNPAGARRQLLGVYAPELVETIGRVLARLGTEHALVVHGADGLDEISTTGPTHVAEVRGEEVRTFLLDPEELGIELAAPVSLLGADAAHNARLMDEILGGGDGPLTDITLVNAAAALYVGGVAPDLPAGLEAARAALAAGAAGAKLEELRTFSHGG